MKTDSDYFENRMADQLVAEGMKPMIARIAAKNIVATAAAKGCEEVSYNATARICVFSADMQSVYVEDQGVATLHTGVAREFQPILHVENFGQPARRRAA